MGGGRLRANSLPALVPTFAAEGVDGPALRALHEHWAQTDVVSVFKCKAGDMLKLRSALNELFR
jgi:hypothetical protein